MTTTITFALPPHHVLWALHEDEDVASASGRLRGGEVVITFAEPGGVYVGRPGERGFQEDSTTLLVGSEADALAALRARRPEAPLELTGSAMLRTLEVAAGADLAEALRQQSIQVGTWVVTPDSRTFLVHTIEEVSFGHRTVRGLGQTWALNDLVVAARAHFCAGASCPGLSWPASHSPHPATCSAPTSPPTRPPMSPPTSPPTSSADEPVTVAHTEFWRSVRRAVADTEADASAAGAAAERIMEASRRLAVVALSQTPETVLAREASTLEAALRECPPSPAPFGYDDPSGDRRRAAPIVRALRRELELVEEARSARRVREEEWALAEDLARGGDGEGL